MKSNKTLPFELYEVQEDFIRWLWDKYINRKDGAVDKCRDVGATWCVIAFLVYLILFYRDISAGLYTYKGDECHSIDDISTLMEKAIFIIKNLPDQFKSQIEHKHMYIINKKTGSDISGSSGDNPGRGGRRTIFVMDECAFYPRAELIEAAVSENSDCKIYISTHSGTNTLFYNKVTSGTTDVFEFNWWQIPGHDQAWYDAKRAKAEAEGLIHIFMREIERDPTASIEGVVIPSSWVNASCRNDNIVKSGKIIGAMDVADGEEGGDTNALCIIQGNNPIYLDETGSLDPADGVDRFFWKCVEYNVDEFRYDCIGVGVTVKVRLKQILKELPPDHKAHKIKLVGWDARGKVIRPNEEDYQEKKNIDLFENAKAQAWWKAREEIRNTSRMVNGKDYDPDKIISLHGLDNIQKGRKLLRELSQAQIKLSVSGKTLIDKKPKGTRSPNIAEAYIIARAEVEEAWLEWASYG